MFVALSLACSPAKQTFAEAVGVDFAIESVPSGATVFEDTAALGATPLRYEVKDTSAHLLTVRKDGYHPVALNVDGAAVTKKGGGRAAVALAPATFESKTVSYADVGQLMRAGAEQVKKGKPADAVEFYRQVIAVNPDHAPAYKGLGAAYAKLGKRDAAVDAYRQYLLRSPDAPDAKKIRDMLDKATEGYVIPQPQLD